MKPSILHWQIGGFLFTAVMGTFLHFLFDLTGGSLWAALFSAVNESIWEHMKLLFYPMLAVAVSQYFFTGRDIPGFWCIKLVGILTGLTVIPVIYYTYTGILGVSADWFNIVIFFLAAGLVYYLETKLFLKRHFCNIPNSMAMAGIFAIAIVFTVLTFAPPHIPLFRDPVTGSYGF